MHRDDFAWLAFTDVDFAGANWLFELGEFFNVGYPSNGQRSADRAERDHLFDFVPDAQQRLFEIVGRNIPARSADCDDIA